MEELKQFLEEKFAKIDANFAKINKKFDEVNKKFTGIDEKFVSIDEKFISINENFKKAREYTDQSVADLKFYMDLKFNESKRYIDEQLFVFETEYGRKLDLMYEEWQARRLKEESLTKNLNSLEQKVNKNTAFVMSHENRISELEKNGKIS